jgi:hypothetical protein
MDRLCRHFDSELDCTFYLLVNEQNSGLKSSIPLCLKVAASAHVLPVEALVPDETRRDLGDGSAAC